MDQVWLIILGSALALIGSVAVQIIRSSAEERQWERERDERRLQQAATDLARLRVFVEEFHPDGMVLFLNPEDPFGEGNRRIEQWRPIRPDVTRIGIVHPELADDVGELVEKVIRMINTTGESIRRIQGNQDLRRIADDPLKHANEAKTEALDLIESVSARLTA